MRLGTRLTRWTLGPGPNVHFGIVLALVAVACDCEEERRAAAESDPVEAPARGDERSLGAMGAPLDPARCGAPSAARIEGGAVPGGLCAWVWARVLAQPRGMIGVEGGDVLVVERGRSRVVALFDGDGDGVSGEDERAVLAEAEGLNHGIALQGAALYASSATTVYRWAYEPGARERLGEPTVVVRGIPSGGHRTRTLIFDAEGRLYVSVGSRANVDPSSARARVMRYALDAGPDGGIEWERGEVWADGLRNEVGLAFDARGRLWGVQNGVDNLARDDLGGDIHADNPAEELNLLDEGGRFHGYPYCWTEYALPRSVGRGRGTQWAHPDFTDDDTHTDAWCRDRASVVPPRFSLPAHTAPLDVMFWRAGALPSALDGDAIVGMHGSWNRPTPIGYQVARIRFEDGAPRSHEPLLESAGDDARSWRHRPVALARGPRGELLVTSDATGVVLAIAVAER